MEKKGILSVLAGAEGGLVLQPRRNCKECAEDDQRGTLASVLITVLS